MESVTETLDEDVQASAETVDERWFFHDKHETIQFTRMERVEDPHISLEKPEQIDAHYSWNEFHPTSGEMFCLREKDYGARKTKIPSQSAMYTTIQSMHFDHTKKFTDIASIMKVHQMKSDLPGKVPLPKYLVINCICPISEPGLFWNGDERYVHGLIVAELAPDTVRRWLEDDLSEADRLFQRWLLEDKKSNPLKAISKMANFQDQLGAIFNKLARMYNGQPYLLHKTKTKMYDGWALITLDLTSFSSIFKRSIWYAKDIVVDCIVDHCLTVEGHKNKNSELPERAIISYRNSRIDYFRLGKQEPRSQHVTCASTLPTLCGDAEYSEQETED